MTCMILVGDCRTRLADLPDGSINTCVTSPPYFGLRDYGHDDQIGAETTPGDFVAAMVAVWTVTTKPYRGAHFATFPPDLIEPCVLAGCPVGGFVLDPFGGAGTTGLVAEKHGRDSFLVELNPTYAAMARDRVGATAVLL